MPCSVHDWYFDSPCPKCAAATVTVAAALPADPVTYVDPLLPEPTAKPEGQSVGGGVAEVGDGSPVPPEATDRGWPVLTDDMPPIPDFLRRWPDNTLVSPEPWGSVKGLLLAPPPAATDVSLWDDAALWDAVSANMSIADRQPIIQEITRRQNKSKTYARLDKAGFTRAKDDTVTE